MKRFFAALLFFSLIVLFPAISAQAAENLTIDSQDAAFPADTTMQDLSITGDCPATVILINVRVEDTLTIDADHPVTVRLQGNSYCGTIKIESKATVIGGTCDNVIVDSSYTTLTGLHADSIEMKYDGGILAVNGTANSMNINAVNAFVGGSGRVEKVVIEDSGCTVNLRCGELVNYGVDSTGKTEDEDMIATFSINPAVSPANSVIDCTVTFTNVPTHMLGDYRIYWYIGDTLSSYDWSFDLKDGATASLHCSAHFYEEVNALPVWVKLVNKFTEEEEIFSTQVNVVGYSLQEFEKMDTSHPYEIHLLRNQNTIIVYGLDEKGTYSKIVNVFTCSTGYYSETALGDFEIGLQMRWGSLMANLYGQYSSQFNYNQLFHSVPYRSADQDNIEWEEYELLGSAASSGCVRLATIDAKWIYDHCHTGTQVKVYDVDTLPVQQPVPCIILQDYLFRGWDPTDPDSDNPSKASNPPRAVSLSVEIGHPIYQLYLR